MHARLINLPFLCAMFCYMYINIVEVNLFYLTRSNIYVSILSIYSAFVICYIMYNVYRYNSIIIHTSNTCVTRYSERKVDINPNKQSLILNCHYKLARHIKLVVSLCCTAIK